MGGHRIPCLHAANGGVIDPTVDLKRIIGFAPCNFKVCYRGSYGIKDSWAVNRTCDVVLVLSYQRKPQHQSIRQGLYPFARGL